MEKKRDDSKTRLCLGWNNVVVNLRSRLIGPTWILAVLYTQRKRNVWSVPGGDDETVDDDEVARLTIYLARTRRRHNEQLDFVIDITHGHVDDRLKQLSRPFPFGLRTIHTLLIWSTNLPLYLLHSHLSVLSMHTCGSISAWQGPHVWSGCFVQRVSCSIRDEF